MNKKLVYDVGAHQGDDSHVYLKMGYRVVAVEANPSLVKGMHARFRDEIRKGDLTILNYLVSDLDNEMIDFYIEPDTSKSSVRKTNDITPIKVKSQRLSSIISTHGKPHYCKIDIEDADLIALKSLEKELPPFISVEVSGKPVKELQKNEFSLFETIDCLYEIGYKKFKLVDQESLVLLPRDSTYQKMRSFTGRIKRRIHKTVGLLPRDVFRRRFGLSIEAELSGYPSDHLMGEWVNYQEAKALMTFHFQEFCVICTNPDFIFWIDVHASLDE